MSEPAIEHAIASYKVAHITFYVTPHPDTEGTYNLFSVARGGEPRFIDVAWSFEGANQMLAIEIRELETRLEAKRNKPPTTKQVMFLFREKIPIPVDLTWGEASDLIEERLAQIAIEREAKLADRHEGFTVGMRVSRRFLLPNGKEQTNMGKITKLTSNGYAYVNWDTWNGMPGNVINSRVPIKALQKTDESEIIA